MKLEDFVDPDRRALIKTVTFKPNAKGGGTIRVWYDLKGRHTDTGSVQLHELPDGLSVREAVRTLAHAAAKA